MNTCGFCGATTGVRILTLKNGYKPDRACELLACSSCVDILIGMAMVLSIYATTDW